MDLDEGRFRDIAEAAESAYRSIREFQDRHVQRHLVRVWNFLDAINEGDGNLERYRQLCVGRSRGLGDLATEKLPAATAVGRTRGTGRVQLCWMASRAPGQPVENPRQVRAYRYPLQYGPSPPAFARAMRLDTGELLASGGRPEVIKVYLRERAGGPAVAEKICARLSVSGPLLMIEADICRRELLVEIECLWT